MHMQEDNYYQKHFLLQANTWWNNQFDRIWSEMRQMWDKYEATLFQQANATNLCLQISVSTLVGEIWCRTRRAKIPVLKHLSLSLWRLLLFSIDRLNMATTFSKMTLSGLYIRLIGLCCGLRLQPSAFCVHIRKKKAWRNMKDYTCNF